MRLASVFVVLIFFSGCGYMDDDIFLSDEAFELSLEEEFGVGGLGMVGYGGCGGWGHFSRGRRHLRLPRTTIGVGGAAPILGSPTLGSNPTSSARRGESSHESPVPNEEEETEDELVIVELDPEFVAWRKYVAAGLEAEFGFEQPPITGEDLPSRVPIDLP